MITRYRASMDGVQLDSLDNSIYIYDIIEQPAKLNMHAAEKPGADGTHITGVRRTSLQLEIQFCIRKRDPASRQAVMDMIAAWSAGTVLTTSTRPGKELHCMCVGLPAVDSALKWADALSITMTAYEIPYWITSVPVYVYVPNVTNDARTINVLGSAPTIMCAEITNAGSSSINSLSIFAGSSLLQLSGLGLQPASKLLIESDQHDRLKISINGVSKYNSLMPQSSDNLVVLPGLNTIRITSNTKVSVDWYYKPRWR